MLNNFFKHLFLSLFACILYFLSLAEKMRMAKMSFFNTPVDKVQIYLIALKKIQRGKKQFYLINNV